jgi:hypothetical protein
MNQFCIHILPLLALIVNLSACAITKPGNYVPPPLPSNARIVGPVEAQACDLGILFFPPFYGSEQASLSKAIREATKGKGFLVNSTVDYAHEQFLLFNRRCTKVKGTLVKAGYEAATREFFKRLDT